MLYKQHYSLKTSFSRNSSNCKLRPVVQSDADRREQLRMKLAALKAKSDVGPTGKPNLIVVAQDSGWYDV
jgi:hypothetical protein